MQERSRDRDETNWDSGISRVAIPSQACACSSLLCNCLFPTVNPSSVSGRGVRLPSGHNAIFVRNFGYVKQSEPKLVAQLATECF